MTTDAMETAPLDEGTMENAGTDRAESPGNLLPAERTRLIEEMLEKLNVEQSRALRGYLSGLNHREVATLYGWSESVAIVDSPERRTRLRQVRIRTEFTCLDEPG